jgi:hypothetical protein
MSYLYAVFLPLTTVASAKTLIQIKAGTGLIVPQRAIILQTTKVSTEQLQIEQRRWSSSYTAGTVTSSDPVKRGNTNDPSSLAVGGTTSTGYNASAEASGGTNVQVDMDGWNILSGRWEWVPVPDDRPEIGNGELYTLKLLTAPSSQSYAAMVTFREYR